MNDQGDTDKPARTLRPEDLMRLVREAGQSGFARRAPAQETGVTSEFKPSLPVRDVTDEVVQSARAAAPRAPEPQHAAPQPSEPDPAEAAAQAALAAREAAQSQALSEAHDQGRSQGFSEGYAAGVEEGQQAGQLAGIDEGRRQAAAELGEARDLFLKAAATLAAPDDSMLQDLTRAVLGIVQQMASDRAGIAIDDHPKAFLRRIEKLAEQAAAGLGQTALHLNPEDHAALRPHLDGSDLLSDSRIVPDAALARGDVTLRIGGIELRDVLAEPGEHL